MSHVPPGVQNGVKMNVNNFPHTFSPKVMNKQSMFYYPPHSPVNPTFQGSKGFSDHADQWNNSLYQANSPKIQKPISSSYLGSV